MKAKAFENIATGWSDKLVWNAAELKKIGSLLFAISKANGGEVAGDTEIADEASDAFMLSRMEDALSRSVIPYAKKLRDDLHIPVYRAPLAKNAAHAIPCLVSHEWNERIDMNTDDVEILCKVPGMKRTIAKEIIKHRKKNGRFDELKQLENIKGIEAGSLAAIKTHAFCRTADQTTNKTPALSAFMNTPTFQRYVASIAGADSFIWSTGKKEDVKQHILAELEKTLDDVTKNKQGVAKNLHYTRTSSVMRNKKSQERAKAINANCAGKTDSGALLYDGQYLPFVQELFGSAKKSIWVMMFFMKYEEGNDYVANPLVESLVAAHKKGLDVKVILDKDAQDDVIGSRLINMPAFEMLARNKVPVFYDNDGRMTHSKLLVVDGEHVVIGSHNWTGGSFLAYSDTSIYVRSKELADKFTGIFTGFWNQYDIVKPIPVPQNVEKIKAEEKPVNKEDDIKAKENSIKSDNKKDAQKKEDIKVKDDSTKSEHKEDAQKKEDIKAKDKSTKPEQKDKGKHKE